MTSLTLLITAVVVIAILAIGFVLVPYLKKKGVLNEQTLQAATQLIDVAGLVLNNLNISNDKVKSEADTIFSITQKVVHFVEQTVSADNSGKKQAAVDTTKEILGKLNIQVTPENEKLIEVGIESAVNALPKTNAIASTQVTVNSTTQASASDVANAIVQGLQQAATTSENGSGK